MPLARLLRYPALALALVFIPACSDDDPVAPGADPIIGTWQVTSFVGLGQDFIANGMSMTITLAADGDYTFAIANDLIGSCDVGSNCADSGTYTATSTQITIDPGTADAVTFNYSINGNTMTWTGSIDGNAATVTMVRS
jgi:hypothetical protein